ncbi:MAG: mechanosensitive ion channel family protein [Chloroflexi bacterium]|nr:mechanosensitive ion channel family protein [Chloroflexota bacterium]
MNLTEITPEQWNNLWVSLLIFAIAVVLGRRLVSLIVGRGLRRIVGMTESTLDDMVLRTILGPLHWLVIVAAFDFGISRLDFIPSAWVASVDSVLFVLYFLIGSFFIVRLVSGLFDWYGESLTEKTEMNLVAQMLPFLRRIALIIVISIASVSLLGRFTDVSALLATLGVSSLAIAFAAQSALEDMFSGFLIMFDRPYLIGDRIQIQELDAWGDVIDIGLRSTRIRTRDNRSVIIPNAVIGKSMIINYSRPDTQYRIQIELGIDYGTDIDLARSTIIDAVREVEGVLRDKKVEALFLRFGDSAMVFRVRWWLDSFFDTRRMFDRVNSAIYNALTEANISISPPQYEIFHRIDDRDINRFSRIIRPAD